MATDLEWLRRKMAVIDDTSMFDDARLQSLLDEEGTRAGALRAGLWEVLVEAAKQVEYSFGQGAVLRKAQQAYDHLKDLYLDLSGGKIPGARKLGALVIP